MHAFSQLTYRLAFTGSRNAKLDLLAAYFAATPDPDRGVALAALTGELDLRLQVRRIIAELLQPHVDPHLYRLSRDYVGDTAETVALLWPETGKGGAPPSLSEVYDTLKVTSRADLPATLSGWLDRLDVNGRWALLKLLTGGLRIGVSARLAKLALARAFGADVSDIEEVWHGLQPPYTQLFAWLQGTAARPDPGDVPVFRPVMLAHPADDSDLAAIDPADWAAEWKWDGIRVQVAGNGRELRLYSRTGDDISAAFPDIADALPGFHAVADGELLVVRGGTVAPFNELQQRLNRKSVTAAMLKKYPAHVRFYDLLFEADDDLRPLSFVDRRTRLERFVGDMATPHVSISELIAFDAMNDLRALRESARAADIEGLMLKRRTSAYLAGRPKGHWFKWKREPLTADCVMMYAQRGSGKRSSLYSDYTFGAWRQVNGSTELVPVGKAYSGFSDEELHRLDRFVRDNTTERFGPVRAVRPELVLEIAFDAVQPSSRHKSGIAMRFPRIHRVRWDKPAAEADWLETLVGLIPD